MLYKRINKVILVSILSTFLFSSYIFASENNKILIDNIEYNYVKNSSSLNINGNLIKDLPMDPIIYSNYLLVPVREVFEPMGATVNYDIETRQCNIQYKDYLVQLSVDNNVALVNWQPVTMAIPAKIINNKLMVPLRFISQAFKFDINWDNDTRTASVYSIPKGVIEQQIAKNEKNEIEKNEIIEKEIIAKEEIAKAPEVLGEVVEPPLIVNNKITVKDLSTDLLEYEEHNLAVINELTQNVNGFTIKASSYITYLEKNLHENDLLIFDIYNSKLSIKDGVIKPNDVSNVNEIRLYSKKENGIDITRVEMDLNKNLDFKVTYTNNRCDINIEFLVNEISNIKILKEENFDVIKINSKTKLNPEFTYSTFPDRLNIDFKSTKLINGIDQDFDGLFITKIESKSPELDFTKLVLDLNSQASYTIETHDYETIIKLSYPTVKNISYDLPNRRIKLKKLDKNLLTVDKISVFDNYAKKSYEIDLGENFQDIYGYGDYYVKDYMMSLLNVKTNITTKIIINENQILLPTITEDEEYVYINLKNPKEVYPLVVVIDPGHGDHDNGAVGNGLQEKLLNTDIAERLYKLIEDENIIKAYYTKEGDAFISLNERANIGNFAGDVFVSIHNNSSPKAAPSGTEVYYYKHYNDEQIGYLSSDMSEVILRHLLNGLGTFDRGSKSGNYAVLRNTTVPAVLLEIAFISNPNDAALLHSPEFRQLAAQSIYNGLIEVMQNYKPRDK